MSLFIVDFLWKLSALPQTNSPQGGLSPKYVVALSLSLLLPTLLHTLLFSRFPTIFRKACKMTFLNFSRPLHFICVAGCSDS